MIPSSDEATTLLSFNMQVGVGTRRYREYITRGWRHLLPSGAVRANLGHIAELIAGHDFVGLQEIDAGSRRSGNLNQIQWLADKAGFAYWHAQVNRDLGSFAQHGLGLLSRHVPFEVIEHRLPGWLPGRGALLARFGSPQQALTVVVTHLALTPGSRSQQLAAICDLIADEDHVIVMGDTNCNLDQLRTDAAVRASRLQLPRQAMPTFPSWRPRRAIDHILTTPGITIEHTRVLPAHLSDHLPLHMQVTLPPAIRRALRTPVPPAACQR